MSNVRILPEILSNKIAAGEVVERPAAVVKELVENAIDAGSDQITIDIEQGGRSVIRISDNGYGMGHDDALLAIERYATSKITVEDDLFNIQSLGFRGEALPSIAAVSRFTMVTRDDKSDAATEIRIEGGKIRSVNPVGAPRGTMITVRQLFYNTPARRKFMKTISTEFGHIADTVACFALSRPEIRFCLTHNGKTVRQWHDVRDPRARVEGVLGENLGRLLYPVSRNTHAALISGWACDPSFTRGSAGKIYTFVNGRFIRDRGIQHAVVEGYHGRLMKGRFPLCVLYLTVPAAEVDVNVHPAKAEVRFSRQQDIYSAVKNGVSDALGEKNPFGEGQWKPADPVLHVKEPPRDFSKALPQPEEQNPFPGHAPAPIKPREEEKNTLKHAPVADETAAPRQAALFSRENLRLASVIGQFHNTYILCEKEAELLLIDQHAAHERILYEQIRNRMAPDTPVQVQQLLVPETVELGYRESAALEQVIPELNQTGLEIETFGPNTFVVKAVPEILAETPIPPLIVEIAEIAEASGYRQGVDRAIEACLILMACHGAVRANHPLTGKQMTAILEQLYACENPYTCPHGRPTMITWHASFLEKRFKRTG
ncbi:MAG: DNA mismatch repair endonuclease MutL [Thermodesulfobacteriota bacterium]